MKQYLLRRAGGTLVTLLLVTIIVFLGVHALPGDPALVLSGEQGAMDPQILAQLRHSYGLDQPLLIQYFKWMWLLLHGDFGLSIRWGDPVLSLVASRISITLEIGVLSMVIAVLLGTVIGVVAAVNRGKLADHLGNLVGLIGLSIPHFWVGLLLIALLAVRFKLLPASGWVPFNENPVENLRHIAMPAVVLGSGLVAIVMRQTRSTMIQTLSEDFIRTARAKGLPERVVIVRHALRNSLLTVSTVVGLQLGVLLAGSVVTEQIFLIPGFGKLMVDSVDARDYPAIQAVALFSAVGYVVLNFLVDILYSVLNPRIRLHGGRS
jgi:peptide/nickel transport system permease protein